MFTKKECVVSDENYEISKKIYYLFKKYKDYDEKSNISKSQEKQPIVEYNPNDLFKNRKKEVNNYSNTKEVALIEVKKENWFIKLVKRLFKIKGE